MKINKLTNYKMKIKTLISNAGAAIIVALSLVGCQDYDNGFTDKVIAYERDFRDAFGKISPEQDWNIATRATVNVTTSQPSNVKIYAYDGMHYSIVGDYSNVVGSRTLGFDVAKGIKKILVTDGRTGQKTTIGGSVSFDGRSTRNITESEYIKVTGRYIEFKQDEALIYQTRLPEIGLEKGGDGVPYEDTNLPKVTKNFKFISNGEFTIHPVFWWTDNPDVLAIYYNDKTKEDNPQIIPFYQIKSSGNDVAIQDLTWENYTISYNPSYDINTNAPNDEDDDKRIRAAVEIIQNNPNDYSSVGEIEYDEINDRFYFTSGNSKYIIKGFVPAVFENNGMTTPSYFEVYRISAPTGQYSTYGYDWEGEKVTTQRSMVKLGWILKV